MPTLYGIAGAPAGTEFPDRMNVMLMNAVQSVWDANVPIPSSSEILFLPTWFTGMKDVELVFRPSFYDQPYWGRSTDWSLQLTMETVDIHLGVRGIADGNEPLFLSSTLQGLERILAIHCRTLVPNAWFAVENIMQGATEKEDDLQTFWHSLMKVGAYYYKCKVETP